MNGGKENRERWREVKRKREGTKVLFLRERDRDRERETERASGIYESNSIF